MKIEMIKEAGGIFRPVNDLEYEKTTRFKAGEQYTVEIKLTRSPAFHRKAFAFLNFCFAHWRGGNEFQDEQAQFNAFRKQLTILAGFRKEIVNLRNMNVGYEAESLSFGNMDQETFESCYNALIQASMTHVFKNSDQNTYNQLLSFFD